ncbi:MAG: M20 family metallopeptidase [Chloroflexi bacterium]|nr:M20 family metallopeptidase [Chloroflexota bacterium]
MTDRSQLKQSVIAAVDAMRDNLIQTSLTLHANPEIAFQERKAAALLGDTLEKQGFVVERGVGDLETAFRAEARGNGEGPAIAILAEYDALPQIGHACGHNIIGTAAMAAGLAVRTVLDQVPGRVVVIGTPAEEGGGGKIKLLERGVFRGIDAAMMVHPSGYTMTNRGSLASNRLKIEFTGKASHAAGSPEDGINALEAVILTFNNINALRLHLKPDARVHGIVTHGGTAVNIIPDYAAAEFSVRARKQGYADEILQRVIRCAEGGAAATGARLQYTVAAGYADMVPNGVMARLFAENWRAIGVEVHEPRPNERIGSTDMGNVSHALPAIHPYIAIAPDGTPGHSMQFREAAISPEGHAGLLDAAKGMAMTTVDLLSDPELMQQVRQEFAKSAEK